MPTFFNDFLSQNHSRLLTTLIIVITALVSSLLVDWLFRSMRKHAPTKRAKTILEVLSNAIKIAIFITMGMLILTTFQVNITPFLASAGIIGIVIGFGSQLLIRDVITGVFFIMENQFNAGDVIQVEGTEGIIEHVGLRTLSIRDADTGALTIMPNGSVTKLSNLSDSWSRAVVYITVPVKNDVDKVKEVLEQTGKEIDSEPTSSTTLLKPIDVYALDDLTDGKMTFKVTIKTHPGMQERVAQHFRYLTKKNFDDAKIDLSA